MLASICSLENVRLEIVPHVTPDCQVSGLFVSVGRLNAVDPRLRQARRSDFLPILPTVRRHVDETVIRPSPDQIAIESRNRQRRNQRIDFCSRLVEIDGSPAGCLRARLVTSEIGGNLLPRRTVVIPLEYALRGSE